MRCKRASARTLQYSIFRVTQANQTFLLFGHYGLDVFYQRIHISGLSAFLKVAMESTYRVQLTRAIDYLDLEDHSQWLSNILNNIRKQKRN